MDRRVADRKASFKKNFEDPRRKREDLQVQIRKTCREQNLAKKRADGHEVGTFDDSMPLAGMSNASGIIIEELPQMMIALRTGDAAQQLEATKKFRKALSIETGPPIQEVIDAGAVQYFVSFLSTGPEDLQFEAAWALTNIASGNQEQTRVVVDAGAIPKFVALLHSPKEDIREQAVWALGNIAGDSTRCRDLVLDADALSPLLQQLCSNQSKASMLRNATWTLSNFCRGKPSPNFNTVSNALPTLANLLFSEDTEILTDACWALSYLSDGPNENITQVLNAGVTKRLVDLLCHPSSSVQTPALRTVGNIVTGDDAQTQIVVNCGAIPNLLILLSSSRKTLQKEACWTISNITAGNRDQIQEVIGQGLIPPLLDLIVNADFDVKKEAAWAVSNAVSGGNDKQVEYLVECGCIPPLCHLLGVRDTKIVSVALEALENILRVGKRKQEATQSEVNQYCELIERADGVALLEKLQDDENEDVYRKVWRMIYTYFPYEENDTFDVTEGSNMADGTVFGGSAPQGGYNFSSMG